MRIKLNFSLQQLFSLIKNIFFFKMQNTIFDWMWFYWKLHNMIEKKERTKNGILKCDIFNSIFNCIWFINVIWCVFCLLNREMRIVDQPYYTQPQNNVWINTEADNRIHQYMLLKSIKNQHKISSCARTQPLSVLLNMLQSIGLCVWKCF